MGFFKDFKEDLSQAVNELLPDSVVKKVDTSDHMVNTLDLEVMTNNEEAENQMREWLDELSQDDDLIFEVNTLEDEGAKEEEVLDESTKGEELKDEDHQDEEVLNEENVDNEVLDEENIDEEALDEENTDNEIPVNEIPVNEIPVNEIPVNEIPVNEIPVNEINHGNEDAVAKEVHKGRDKNKGENKNNQISNQVMEGEKELMGKNEKQKLDEIVEENLDLEGIEDNGDDNIDMELLDALNAEEEKVEKKPESKLRATSVFDEDDVTVISKGTTISGNISSEGSLDIMGNITGDVECLGKLSITGKIVGNSTAAEVYVNTERVEGSISSEGSVKVGLGTVVVGDVTGTSGVIAGAVKGEIDINGPIVVDSTAIIKGNIKAKSVQINNGAIIEGFCSLSYSDVDVDNVFE